MDGNAIRTRFPYPNTVLGLAPSQIRTEDEIEGPSRGKENIKKSMYTKEKKGKMGAERHSLGASIRASIAENQNKEIIVAHTRYAVARKSTEITCPSAVHSLRDLFGRIASMQDLYIGRTGTTANRSSSRANFTAAAASSSPATANRASASCLEQTDVLTLELRWL
jgi:hypothetical protein